MREFYVPHPAQCIYLKRAPLWKRVPRTAWAVLLAAVLAFWAWLVMESSHVL